jgi:GT2 family glycosyltransferase/Tfp pilus assembly protein PilF/glycosyltransferase involved in cell wall biosynthesis
MKSTYRILILSDDKGAVLHTRVTSSLDTIKRQADGGLEYAVAGSESLTSKIDISGYDIIVAQRLISSDWAEEVWQEAHSRGKTLIFEIDDLLWRMPSDHPHAAQYRDVGVQHKLIKFISLADGVTVSTPELKRQMSSLHDNIIVVPNLIDTSIWKLKSPSKNKPDPVIIGFIGTPTHESDLLFIEDELIRIGKEYGPTISFQFYGCATSNLRQLPNLTYYKPEPMHFEAFAKKFSHRRIDIGLAPLLDNPFNRCKSNSKWLEYTACGAAGILADIPTYNESIRDGETGLLAGMEPSQWGNALAKLIDSQELRQTIVRKAQAELLKNYSLQGGAHRLLDAYRTIAKDKSIASRRRKSGNSIKRSRYDGMAAFRRQMIQQRIIDARGECDAAVLHNAADRVDGYKVDIVIPIHGRAKIAGECIESVLKTTGPDCHLILFDDASPENEIAPLFRQFDGHSRITLMRTTVRSGFVSAARQGAAAGTAPYILFLDSSVCCGAPGWLERMIPAGPNVAITGAKLLFPPKLSNGLGGRVQHAGVARDDNGEPYHLFRGWRANAPEVAHGREVNAVTGAALLTRREVWQQCGGFDPAYGRGFLADTDYCWSVREAGYKIEYIAGAQLYQWGDGGISIDEDAQELQLEKSRAVFRAKWKNQGSDEHLFLGRKESSAWRKARLLLKQIDDENACDLAEQAATIAPRLPDAQSMYARTCAKQHHWKTAETAYMKWIRLEPANAAVMHELVRLLLQQGKWNEAETWIKKALLLDPSRQELYIMACTIFSHLERWDDFHRVLCSCFVAFASSARAILQFLPKVAAVHLLQPLDDALRLAPDHLSLLNAKVHLQVCCNLFDEASKTIEEEKRASRNRLAAAKEKIDQKSYSEARAALAEILHQDNENTEAQQLMARLSIESGEKGRGLQQYRQLFSRKGYAAPFLLEYLHIALEHRNQATAIGILDRLLRLELKAEERQEVVRLASVHPDFPPLQLLAEQLRENGKESGYAFAREAPYLNAYQDSILTLSLILFGAGAGGRTALNQMPASTQVVAFADNDKAKHGKVVCGLRVLAPEELLTATFDYVVISSIYHEAIAAQLRMLGIHPQKIKLMPSNPSSFEKPGYFKGPASTFNSI